MTKKERQKKKIRQELGIENERGNTWTGYRPAVFKDKTKDIKAERREQKRICREAQFESKKPC